MYGGLPRNLTQKWQPIGKKVSGAGRAVDKSQAGADFFTPGRSTNRPAIPQVGGYRVAWELFQGVTDCRLKEESRRGVRGAADRLPQGPTTRKRERIKSYRRSSFDSAELLTSDHFPPAPLFAIL